MALASRKHGFSMAKIACEGAKRQACICFVTVLHLYVLPAYLPQTCCSTSTSTSTSVVTASYAICNPHVVFPERRVSVDKYQSAIPGELTNNAG